jgi:hypothetical protein
MTLINDTRFAVRSLFRSPGFAAVTILTLGLGIGMSVAVWSVVDAVLIEVGLTLPELGTTGYPVSALDYLDFAERNRSFEPMAVLRSE